MRVTRIDYAGPTRSVRQTPQGGVCVEAAVALAGVLEYSDGDRTWREYRPAEEVFAADSLATLRGAVVTDGHPSKLVTPATFATVCRGNTLGDPRQDGHLVVSDLMVQDAELCRLVLAGERRDVSCGYTCEVDKTPGVTPDGEKYDAIQRRIRHNHVALLPPGEGRSGPEVSLRMDGAAVEVRRIDAAKGLSMKRTIKIKGKVFRLDGESPDEEKKAMDEAQGAVDEVEKKADADATELAALKAVFADAMKRLAALEGATPEVTEEMVPEAIADSLAAKRGALLASARKVLGAEVKLDGLKAGEIHKQVVTKAHPTMKLDGLSADTIRGMYEVVVASASERNDALGLARAPLGPPSTNPSTRADATDATPTGLARRTSEAWRTSKPTFTVRGS
jgi:hypothetical protein